jgi:ribonucleoside-diphosphate reductase alpha chain
MTSDVAAIVSFNVVRRDGSVAKHERQKLISALTRCLQASADAKEQTTVKALAKQEMSALVDKLVSYIEAAVVKVVLEQAKLQQINVQTLSSICVQSLMDPQFKLYEAAIRYLRYTDEKNRNRKNELTAELVDAFEVNAKYFTHPIQRFQALDKFARFIPEKGRRENWEETVARTVDFFKEHCQESGYAVPDDTWGLLGASLLNLKAGPSMRCVQMAGPALKRCHVGVYNCAFQFLQSPRDMAEELYVLMQGTGVGFSVEAEFAVEKFPRVKRQKKNQSPLTVHVIDDTTEGWCSAYELGLNTWFNGDDIEFDFSQIRKEGTPLKTKGGKASGPGPLKDLLEFARKRILARQGRHLSSLDLHDINCYAHRIVKMGGVRRASGISLSDLHDKEMRDCKQGEFWSTNEQRNQANNSAVYSEKPTDIEWMEEWLSLARSGSGERGIFNRGALRSQFPKRRKYGSHLFGTNPCGEIILRHKQFCNLTIAIVRPEDTLDEIKEKVKLATIWGTLQSTMTKFNYIGEEWKKNSEEERLLGVDLLGFLDHSLFQNNALASVVLEELRALVIETNAEWAAKLGINVSAAATCIKPSGDSSVLFATAAGFKGHHGEYFVRRTRSLASNPVAQMLKEAGVPCHTDYDGNGLVLEWPMKAPDGGVLLESQTAISQLEQWKTFKLHWTEHNPSVTIYVRDNEWLTVGKWVYDNWDIVGGLSFLPYDGGVYSLAPYEEISETEYNTRMASFPQINWAKLVQYETEDMTDLQHQFACTGDKCTI